MSEKTETIIKHKPASKVLRWGLGILGVLILEGIAVSLAVFISEKRSAENEIYIKNLADRLTTTSAQITALEKLPLTITAHSEQIATNSGMLSLLTENLNEIKGELNNNKFELLHKQMSALNHRMNSYEEARSEEPLILSLALIIKENALYQRSFASEADILAQLAENQADIQNDVQTLISLKDTIIDTDTQLISRFNEIAEEFSFDKPQADEEAQKKEDQRSAVARSIDLIKDTVAGINFDKVVVLKKDKKTNEQRLLLTTLAGLVEAHNFADALTFIEDNPQFNEANNQDFKEWQIQIQKKISFDAAISHIIASEIKTIREDFKSSTGNHTSKHMENSVND